MPQNGCTGSPQRGVEFNLGTPPISPCRTHLAWAPPSDPSRPAAKYWHLPSQGPLGLAWKKILIDRSMSSSKRIPPLAQASNRIPPPRSSAPAPTRRPASSTRSLKKPTRKEIESTEPGGAPTVIERTLPSFFDFYPRAKRAYDALKKKGPAAARLELLRACETVLTTGNADAMGKLVKAALAGEAGDAERHRRRRRRRGRRRYLPLAGRRRLRGLDGLRRRVERRRGARAQGRRDRDDVREPVRVEALQARLPVQVNTHTGTTRPVRYVSCATILARTASIRPRTPARHAGPRRRHGALKPRAPPQDECRGNASAPCHPPEDLHRGLGAHRHPGPSSCVRRRQARK